MSQSQACACGAVVAADQWPVLLLDRTHTPTACAGRDVPLWNPGESPIGCGRCGATAAKRFHHAGCPVSGGRHADGDDNCRDGLGKVACGNYPLDYPGCHPANPVECSDCMEGLAHVGIFGDRARDPNRVLFVEVRALIPGACFLVSRDREPARAIKARDDVRRLIHAARSNGRRDMLPPEPLRVELAPRLPLKPQVAISPRARSRIKAWVLRKLGRRA